MNARTLALAAALTLTSLPALAQTSPAPPAPAPPAPSSAPSTGLAFLITGGIASGLGAVNVLTSPLCELSIIRSTARTSCVATSLITGGALLAVGVPLLVVGARRRAAWLEWTKGTTVTPLPGGGAGATWSTSF